MNRLNNDEALLLERALDALGWHSDVRVSLVGSGCGTSGYRECKVTLDVGLGDVVARYSALIKRAPSLSALGEIKARLDLLPQPAVLVASHVSPRMANQCRRLGLQFIDAQGNAFLAGSGYWVFVTGQRESPSVTTHAAKTPTGRRATVAGMKVQFALLADDRALQASQRDIAEAANVSLGAVSAALEDLRRVGLVMEGSREVRRLLDRNRMISDWVINYPIKLRPKMLVGRFKAASDDWWQHVDIGSFGAMWGGEVAADRLTQYLKPAVATIYMHERESRQNLLRLVGTARLRSDPDGDIEVLKTFWGEGVRWDGAPDCVHPMLVYADLQNTFDSRNHEVARLIHERWMNGTACTSMTNTKTSVGRGLDR